MSIHSIGEHRRRNEESRAGHKIEDQPIGVFRACSTRDANALERNGQKVFAMNDVSGANPGPTMIEVLFGDGHWMLCESEEIADA